MNRQQPRWNLTRNLEFVSRIYRTNKKFHEWQKLLVGTSEIALGDVTIRFWLTLFIWAHWNEIVKLWNVYLMLIFPEYRHKSEIWPFSLNMTKRGHFSPQCARFSAEPVKMKEKPRSRSLEEVASASKWRARQMKASASKCGIKRGQEKNKMEKRWLLKPNFRGTQPLKRTRRKMREVKYSNLWHHQLDFCSSFFII